MTILKEFIYSDLFEVLPQKTNLSKSDFVKNGKTPAYSSASTNNGLLGFVNIEPSFRITPETPVYIVFGTHTITMNIVHENFCAMNNTKVLKPKFAMSDEQLIYITTSWRKAIPNLGYATHWPVARKAKFKLPVVESSDPSHVYTVADINWQYMHDRIVQMEHDRIVQMEHDRIVELNAYLLASKLDDYELTDDDKKVLSDENKAFRNFEIQDVFEKIETPKIKAKAGDFPTQRSEKCSIPLLTSGASNQGFSRYAKPSDYPMIIKNCISIASNGDAGSTFYQPDDFAVLQDAYAIRVINHEIANPEEGLYLASALNKAIKPKHSWNDKANWSKIKTDTVQLPVDNDDNIDWQHMQRYIRAIEKLTVANVVQYKDKVIETTKQLVASGSQPQPCENPTIML